MLLNRSKGMFCDGIVGSYGIPFDLKTDFEYPDKYKSDRNPTKKCNFYHDTLDEEDKIAYRTGYYGSLNTPYINESLRHYNVFRDRFVNGNCGHNGVPQSIIDRNNKLKTTTKEKIRTKSEFWNKKIGWNIWIALSLLSMIAIPALYGVIYNDVATGIAMWIVLQLFSLPGYIGK